MTATIQSIPRLNNGDLGHPVATLDPLDAAYHTANAYPGGVPALAQRMPPFINARGELTPMRASTLQHKVNPNCHTHHLSLRESVAMQELSGDFRILHAMAASLGHVAISMRSSEGMTMDCLRSMVKEFSDVLSAFTVSDADNVVTLNEFRECEREAAELIAAVNSAVGAMRARLPRGAK